MIRILFTVASIVCLSSIAEARDLPSYANAYHFWNGGSSENYLDLYRKIDRNTGLYELSQRSSDTYCDLRIDFERGGISFRRTNCNFRPSQVCRGSGSLVRRNTYEGTFTCDGDWRTYDFRYRFFD